MDYIGTVIIAGGIGIVLTCLVANTMDHMWSKLHDLEIEHNLLKTRLSFLENRSIAKEPLKNEIEETVTAHSTGDHETVPRSKRVEDTIAEIDILNEFRGHEFEMLCVVEGLAKERKLNVHVVRHNGAEVCNREGRRGLLVSVIDDPFGTAIVDEILGFNM